MKHLTNIDSPAMSLPKLLFRNRKSKINKKFSYAERYSNLNGLNSKITIPKILNSQNMNHKL